MFCKIYLAVNFVDFVYFCITLRKGCQFATAVILDVLTLLHGYIFRILQTKMLLTFGCFNAVVINCIVMYIAKVQFS
jgi:uncharacterized membrane protein YvlD (DUF360 family)